MPTKNQIGSGSPTGAFSWSSRMESLLSPEDQVEGQEREQAQQGPDAWPPPQPDRGLSALTHEPADQADQLGEPWLQVSLALFVLALVLGGLGGQRPKTARRLARRLAQDGDPVNRELRRLLDDPLSLAANYASTGLVLVILVLMVWQPGR